jgi:peptidoglycan-associated lipoprotein
MKTSWRLFVPLAALCFFAAGCPDKKPKYPACKGDKDCKENEKCVDKKCVQCATDADCKEGEECNDANACVKKEGWCTTDADCPDRQICENNKCTACESDEQCDGGRCSNGQCIKPGQCAVDEDCEDDEDCIDGRCQRLGLGGDQPDVGCTLATVYFDFDTAKIRSDMRAGLEAAVECLSSTDKSVFVVGHTDNQGTDEYNIALSDGRARAVADYLAALGIDPARFHVVPKGEADAVGTDDASRSKDRRVEFEWK